MKTMNNVVAKKRLPLPLPSPLPPHTNNLHKNKNKKKVDKHNNKLEYTIYPNV
jgi:hypothetical protein